ncbi:hypothetical protein P3S68_014862 [Capsicum galapagoense]
MRRVNLFCPMMHSVGILSIMCHCVPSIYQEEKDNLDFITKDKKNTGNRGFNESNLIGNGSISMVYKGILEDGTLLAVKVFNMQLEGAFKSFDTECKILRNLRHRNLTKVITSCSNLDFKALVLEYMPNGTLDKWLYSHNLFLSLLQRLDIMIDVASAMDYLHNAIQHQW